MNWLITRFYPGGARVTSRVRSLIDATEILSALPEGTLCAINNHEYKVVNGRLCSGRKLPDKYEVESLYRVR